MIKNILFDFDGVILDSMPIREYGFRKIFEDFNVEDIEKLLVYHNANGGFSRFVKIRYFFEEVLKRNISDDEVQGYAENFSKIMRSELVNKKYLIKETVDFILENQGKYNFHIVSGSEHNELNFLCQQLGLANCFLDINGSPTPKIELVKSLMVRYKYDAWDTILIGDAMNDYDAAVENEIRFYGYNNPLLKKISYCYLYSYSELINYSFEEHYIP